MSTIVILDADFLSAFLKIKRLPLLLSFYQVERLHIPTAVYRELAVTNLLPSLLAFPWITVEEPALDRLAAIAGDEALSVLGAGEQEAIALALEHPGSVLHRAIHDIRHRINLTPGRAKPAPRVCARPAVHFNG